MSIQPSAAVTGLAGTARAQQRGSDTETVRNQQAAVNQSESPGQAEGADQLTLEASSKTGDRDGDGRRPFELQEREQTDGEQSESTSHVKPIDDDCGEQLDLEV
ncbi:hypothetical protein Poly24_35170 [Rosistilla carotiformis]|uniref:Uncharacterized protein n=1 Tax=Rosistilla carotiformis TaxID=2528017 RepID=A0A518JW88_9BACT|nr:hypothetical protein [Rosistilla carotiformis]QDV69800.1 hypothetical protein Poly24_35170 [Rosistilla carotiformis]